MPFGFGTFWEVGGGSKTSSDSDSDSGSGNLAFLFGFGSGFGFGSAFGLFGLPLGLPLPLFSGSACSSWGSGYLLGVLGALGGFLRGESFAFRLQSKQVCLGGVGFPVAPLFFRLVEDYFQYLHQHPLTQLSFYYIYFLIIQC